MTDPRPTLWGQPATNFGVRLLDRDVVRIKRLIEAHPEIYRSIGQVIRLALADFLQAEEAKRQKGARRFN